LTPVWGNPPKKSINHLVCLNDDLRIARRTLKIDLKKETFNANYFSFNLLILKKSLL